MYIVRSGETLQFQPPWEVEVRSAGKEGPSLDQIESHFSQQHHELEVEMPENSDSEDEIELQVYERRRERNARRIVLAERLFADLRKRIYEEKMKQLEKRQAEVLNQEALDYVRKREEILREHSAKLQLIEVTRALRAESLRRRTVGQLECARQNLINNKRLAYENLETKIKDQMQKLDDDIRKCTKEYVDFCREFERNKERERRRRRRNPVAKVIARLLGEEAALLMDSYDEDVAEDLYVCEQALRAVNTATNATTNGNGQQQQ